MLIGCLWQPNKTILASNFRGNAQNMALVGRQEVGKVSLAHALEMVARTDPGAVRSCNEDAIYSNPVPGLAILADGMGGYNAGEVASAMATTRLADDLGRLIATRSLDELSQPCDSAEVASHMLDAVSAANFAIYSASRSFQAYAGMGTTLVLAWFYNNRMSVAHAGDSRLYRLRGEVLEQLTRDHSLLQEQLDSGMITPEQARRSEDRNLVTRALGVDPTVEIELREFDLVIGDIVLLCSDGLHDMVEDEEIRAILRAQRECLQTAADSLIQAAITGGGWDNVSVILIKVLDDFVVSRGWWRRLLAGVR